MNSVRGHSVTMLVLNGCEIISERNNGVKFTRNPLTWCITKIILFTLSIEVSGFRDLRLKSMEK